jgi:hypothetical protein
MISALLYLQYWSVRNRLVTRFQRLRQPKYLAGAIVGGMYFYFYLGHRFSDGGHQHSDPSPESIALYEMIGALVLAVILLFAWIFPRDRAALAFSEAEVAFLFPAPVTRRGLIHFKLLRSGMAIFFSAIFFALVSRRFGGGNGWIHAVSWFLILSTLNLHILGASFTRTILLDRGITNWTRRIVVLVLVLIVVGVVAVWARNTFPSTTTDQLDNPSKIQTYAQLVLSSGPLPYLLAPFRWLVQPYFAPNLITLLMVVWPAIGLVALHYFWVIASDVAFEEGSLDASRKLAEKTAAIRSGNWRTAGKKRKALRAPFALSPTGFAPVALLWKNLISAGQGFSARMWIRLVALVVIVVAVFHHSSPGSPVPVVIGLTAAMLLGYSLLIGPQFLRYDFRQDLMLADTMKLFPLPGWQIALGELLAPAAILTGFQWCMLIVLVGFVPKEAMPLPWSQLLSAAGGAAVILPGLNLISLLIPNAAVLSFPAWFQLGKTGPQGIEATGQRLIFVFGYLVVLILALVPAALIWGGLFLLGHIVINNEAGIILGSIGAAIVLGCEVFAGLKWLGTLFERFDLVELPG